MQGIHFDDDGLVPAIAQDARTGQVRMLGYMNQEAVSATVASGALHFYSRSRQKLWKKGETSGNIHRVLEIRHDCDGDTLLVQVIPEGPTCHTGADTCFDDGLVHETPQSSGTYHDPLRAVAAIIADRQAHPVEGSYTNYLLREGIDKIGKKIGEESAEVIIGAKNDDDEAFAGEAVDLIYHLLVMLQARQVSIDTVLATLQSRHQIRQAPASPE